MNQGKIGDQNVEFFKRHLFFFWRNKIRPAVKKLWPVKEKKVKNILSQNKTGALSLKKASRSSTVRRNLGPTYWFAQAWHVSPVRVFR